jgi:acyl carrier protein
MVIAKYLATACRARLVLTKRTAFPEKSEWKKLLKSDQTPRSTVKLINDLLELESLGAEVAVIVAEVSDRDQMRGVLQETLSRFKSINGVIHAAGIARAGLIQAATKDMADAVLSPKVQGTLVLHKLLKDIDLDFLVLFSSMASIVGPFAHAEYSAANSFLDAFATYSNSRRPYRAVSINWPVWKEVGSVARLETFMGVEGWRDEALKKAILTKDGLEIFRRILSSDLTQVIVSSENLDGLLSASRKAFAPSVNLSPARAAGSAMSARVQITAADRPTDEIETAVAEIWSSVFGIEQIGIHEEFASLGGHSLLALQLITRIRAVYDVTLTLRDFFTAPTISRLSSFIRDQLMMDIESLTEDEVRELIAHAAEQDE